MNRLNYLLRRLLQAIPVLIAIVVLNFMLLQLADGDAVDVIAGEAGSATPEYIAQLRESFGLDQPWYVQLGHYMVNMAQLDLGYSFRQDAPVLDLIMTRLGPTLLLMVSTLVLSATFGCFLGLLAAVGLNTWRDNLISIFALVSYATPLFWVALMFIVVFSIHLHWLPTSGMETIGAFYEGWDRVFDIAWHMILPVTTLSLFYLAAYTRLMRASMLEQRGMDYVMTAQAKGLPERVVTYRHILRNALLPVITLAGVQTGSMLGGSVLVESVFGWPGLGMLAYDALFSRDLNLLLGIFFTCACLVVIMNLCVDLLYTFLDPRIDLQ